MHGASIFPEWPKMTMGNLSQAAIAASFLGGFPRRGVFSTPTSHTLSFTFDLEMGLRSHL